MVTKTENHKKMTNKATKTINEWWYHGYDENNEK